MSAFKPLLGAIVVTVLLVLAVLSNVEATSTHRQHQRPKNALHHGRGIQRPLKGVFWHLTDFHNDWAYAVGGNPENMCHAQDTPFPGPRAQEFGNYLCDAPTSLILSSLKFAVQTEPDPDFIFWTGDDLPHDLYGLSVEKVLDSIQNSTNWIAQSFPHTRVFPALGNHDMYPAHQITVGPNWLFGNVSQYWSRWLSEEALETFKIGGYYTELIQPGLRVVSLNTVFYYINDHKVTSLSDPAGQFAWMNQTLTAARQNKERVYIIGHVPMGADERNGTANFWPQFNAKFLETILPFSDVIIAHIYGHEHSDTFKLLYDLETNTQPKQVALLSPSITPWYNNHSNSQGFNTPPNNPGIRIYEYSPQDYSLLNYHQFWTDLKSDNEAGQITWKLEYTATEAYNIEDLSVDSMAAVWNFMSGGTPEGEALFQKYFLYNQVSYPLGQCKGQCQTTQLCAIRHADYANLKECIQTVEEIVFESYIQTPDACKLTQQKKKQQSKQE